MKPRSMGPGPKLIFRTGSHLQHVACATGFSTPVSPSLKSSHDFDPHDFAPHDIDDFDPHDFGGNHLF